MTGLAGLGTTAMVLDADGNLFPSEEPAFVASADVTNAFLVEIGVPQRFTAEQLRLATTGKNFRTTAVDLAVADGVALEPALAGRQPVALAGADRVGGGMGDGASGAAGGRLLTAEALERWVAEEKRRVSAYLGEVLRPDPSVLEPLRRFADRYLLAVASSSASTRLDACFRATGLADLVPAALRFSAEDSLPVPTSKPDPAVYLYACEQVGVLPQHALAVEDSVPGARSAVAAGIPTVGNVQFVPLAERAEREELLRAEGVVAVVSSWLELEEMLAEV